ncbi:hypothetical protein BDA96_04G333000 [Sorghum bicolor]|uniref:Uncharacterized protein n=2 Tax=Sorghum bicolor TaxID=4558 RepID=A0A921R7Y6_SORBI|nr:hypothetical protein BDA96_04G333000 [Sorghum bicolor]OQU85799.1 hypothetical protein SORBI_3004G311550 [Sorghum bicolor]
MPFRQQITPHTVSSQVRSPDGAFRKHPGRIGTVDTQCGPRCASISPSQQASPCSRYAPRTNIRRSLGELSCFFLKNHATASARTDGARNANYWLAGTNRSAVVSDKHAF